MIGRSEEQKKPNVTITMFISLNILILTFFIYLSSISVVDEQKHKATLSSVAGAFSMTQIVLPKEGGGGVLEGGKSELDLKKQFIKTREETLRKLANQKGIADKIEITKKGEDLIIRMQQSVLFDAGSAEIKSDVKPILMFIGDWIKVRSLNASIEGHTDNSPIHTETFPSNWELSSIRATSILRFLVESAKVPEGLLVAKGFGESRPIADNSTIEGREKNKRVEIILLGANKRYARKGFWTWFDITKEE